MPNRLNTECIRKKEREKDRDKAQAQIQDQHLAHYFKLSLKEDNGL